MKEIDEIEAAEEERYGEKDLEEVGEGKGINAEELKKAAQRINEKLKEEPKNMRLKKAKQDVEKDFIPREEKYEQQEKKFQGRNSYSKTDEDATFMRMKEDHMLNGQLKRGYNIPMGTENQFAVGYSIHQRAGDTSCLKEHLEKLRGWLGEYPETLIADAGYGSEENYAYLQEKTLLLMRNTIPFIMNRRSIIIKNNPYRTENFTYLAEADQYVCPQGKKLSYLFTQKNVSDNHYVSSRRIYECPDCGDCPVKIACTRSKYNRRLYVGMELLKIKKWPATIWNLYGARKCAPGVRSRLNRSLAG